jgi:NAD(P)-dependent dehydrogenase (short-subunit alcohol dehydrogenase family)
MGNALDGKVAIVTGANRGIGAASARELARAGAQVVVAARGAAALDQVAASLDGNMGGPRVSSAADLIRAYVRARHRRRPVVPVWMPGIRKVRAGALPVADQETAPAQPGDRRTWQEFLAEKLS